MTPLLLVSTGLSTDPARTAFREAWEILCAPRAAKPPPGTAAVITTASREYKERNRHAIAARDLLIGFGIARTDFVDLEFEDAEVLRGYDLLYINGGDPYYLMHHLRRTRADAMLREFVRTGEKAIIGASAGAVALGPDLRIVMTIDPDLVPPPREEASSIFPQGVGLVPFTVLPHADRWQQKLPDLDARLRRFTVETAMSVEPIRDGEALLVRAPTSGEGRITRFLW